MKIALLTDTHIGASNDHPIQINNIDKFFTWFWGEVDRLGITHIFHLGDMMDNRTRISYHAAYQLKRCVLDPAAERNIEFHMIVGNHDILYRTTLDFSSAVLMEGKKNIFVYNEPTEICLPDGSLIGMVPWIHKNNNESTTKFLNETGANFIMGHLEIKGAQMMKGVRADHGQDHNVFSRFPKVFSGHFHHVNSYENIHYIGNTIQMNWGDYGEDRGFTILDTETGEHELQCNPFSPFQKLYYDDVDNSYDDLTFLDKYDLSNMFIRVIVVQKQNPYFLERYVQKVTDRGAYSVQVVEHDSVEFSATESDADESDIQEFKADTITILNEYVNTSAMSDEQAVRVMKIMREIYAEASSRRMNHD